MAFANIPSHWSLLSVCSDTTTLANRSPGQLSILRLLYPAQHPHQALRFHSFYLKFRLVLRTIHLIQALHVELLSTEELDAAERAEKKHRCTPDT